MKSICDDDLCSRCERCSYNPGSLSMCSLGFPATSDLDGYIATCHDFKAPKPVECGLNKTEYRTARRMVRDNGRAALRWLDGTTRAVMERLQEARKDALAERADIVAYCQSIGTYCTPMHTADMGLLARFQDRKST